MRRLTRAIRGHFLTFIIVAPALGGAACDPAERSGDDPAAALEGDHVDGLTLTSWTTDRVEGEYARGGAVVRFTLEHDGARRTATIHAADGTPLFTSVLEAGVETVSLFGGRAVLTGATTAVAPALDGDPAAFDEFAAMPEASCVSGLRRALLDAGVADELVGGAAGEDTVSPRNQYVVLDPHESKSFPTWTFWGWTSVSVTIYETWGTPWVLACARLEVSPYEEHLCTTGQQSAIVARQWAGRSLKVTNIQATGVALMVHVW